MKTETVKHKKSHTGRPRLQILYIRKPDGRFNRHEHIELIGGRNPDRSLWTMSQEEAIEEIKAGNLEFFVHTGKEIVPVVTSTSRWDTEYLRTVKDRVKPNNLLRLPSCPRA
jgi:hypothetical protein